MTHLSIISHLPRFRDQRGSFQHKNSSNLQNDSLPDSQVKTEQDFPSMFSVDITHTPDEGLRLSKGESQRWARLCSPAMVCPVSPLVSLRKLPESLGPGQTQHLHTLDSPLFRAFLRPECPQRGRPQEFMALCLLSQCK